VEPLRELVTKRGKGEKNKKKTAGRHKTLHHINKTRRGRKGSVALLTFRCTGSNWSASNDFKGRKGEALKIRTGKSPPTKTGDEVYLPKKRKPSEKVAKR